MAKSMGAIILRLTSAVTYLSAFLYLLYGSETVNLFGRIFSYKFGHWAFSMFFAVVNLIAFLYNLLIIIFPTESPLWPLIVCIDVALNQLLVGSLAAMGLTTGFMKNGDEHLKWAPICGVVPKFCRHQVQALVCSSIGLFLSVVLNYYTLGRALNPLLVPKPGLKKPSRG